MVVRGSGGEAEAGREHGAAFFEAGRGRPLCRRVRVVVAGWNTLPPFFVETRAGRTLLSPSVVFCPGAVWLSLVFRGGFDWDWVFFPFGK